MKKLFWGRLLCREMELLRSVEPGIAIFPPTYVTSVSRLTVKINNDSNKILKYEWRASASDIEEKEILSKCDLFDPEQREAYAGLLLFKSDIFEIEPMSSEVWPNASQHFVVTFKPSDAQRFSETAFLYDKESGQRITFSMTGNGLPPDVSFDVSQINVGHVFLRRNYEYRINIRNHGLVRARFSINRLESQIGVDFSPREGVLEVGESKPVMVLFSASKVGQFRENFDFETEFQGIKGLPATLTICGKVLGPSFTVSRRILDFGVVGFGFLYSQEFEVSNVSEIPFDFYFRFVASQKFETRELSVVPDEGTLEANSTMTVRVDFIPITVQDYNVQMLMESTSIDGPLATINVRASCICPVIRMVTDVIDLGRIYIGHQYTAVVELSDETVHPAKFEFVEATDQSILQARVSSVKVQGVLHAKQISKLPIYFTPLQLGHMTIRRYFKILGSDMPPLAVDIKALSVGPDLEMSVTDVNFGQIGVLADITQIVRITNNSLIEAPFTATIESSSLVFRIPENSGVIPPGESIDFPVIAHLDDTLVFTGELTFFFQNLLPIKMNVNAKGVGTAIVPSIDMSGFNLGYVFTRQPITTTFVLENHGRRSQTIKWTQQKAKLEATEGKPVFHCVVEPDQIVIPARGSQEYLMTFTCSEPCAFTYAPQCYTLIGNKRFDLFKPNITGIFINPALQFQCNSMRFVYVHDTEAEERLGTVRKSNAPSRELMKVAIERNSVTNISHLPLIAEASISHPFFLSIDHFELESGQTMEFEVGFDPSFKTNFDSEVINTQVTFNFRGNPATSFVNVVAEMYFPNVSFSPASVDFGVLVKHTEKTVVVKMLNVGALPLKYSWELVSSTEYKKDISKIFDVYPTRGELAPNEDDDTHFTFFALSNERLEKYETVAICHVSGGPDYFINVTGSSADIVYHIDPQTINLGPRHYAETVATQVVIQNMSDVPFEFQIHVPKVVAFKMLEILPMNGKVKANDKVVLKIRIQAGLPKEYKQKFFVRVGQFNDTEINVTMECGFPQLQIDLPRDEINDPICCYANDHNFHEASFVELERALMLESQIKQQSIPTYRLGRNSLFDRNRIRNLDIFKGYVASRFIVDFGEITLGDFQTKTFTLTNSAIIPVSFEILDRSLNQSGFSITPVSFANVAPGESISVTISFDSDKCMLVKERTDMSFDLPVVFSIDLGYLIHLTATVTVPKLEFSEEQFEFETTVVGQNRTMRLQIQNNHNVPLEFKWGKAEFIKSVPKNRGANSFTASVTDGVLPPLSMQVVEVVFAPTCEKAFAMQFPVTVKYNPQISYFTVYGKSLMMKLHFDPPELTFPSIEPFSDPSFAQFDIVNPTPYIVEVYSPVFDFKNLCDFIQEKYQEEPKKAEEPAKKSPLRSSSRSSSRLSSTKSVKLSPVFEEKKKEKLPVNTITRFSLCVVVHGPMKSGRTTIANEVAQIMGGVPVLCPRTFWLEMLFNNATDEELEVAIKEELSNKKYLDGVVIDGLDVFPEPPEMEQFLTQCLKQKSIFDETVRNPLSPVPVPFQTASQRAMSILTKALSGYHIIILGLRVNDVTVEQREMMVTEQARREKEEEERQLIESCVQMTQEDYQTLTNEQQQEVDRVRSEYRKKLLVDEPPPKSTSRRNASSRRMSRDSGLSRTQKGRTFRRTIRRDLTNPRILSFEAFQFTFGSLCSSVANGDCQSTDIGESVFYKEQFLSSKVWAEKNCLVIDATNPVDILSQDLSMIIPTLDDMIENDRERAIAPPEYHIPEVPKGFIHTKDLPKIFTFVNEEPPGQLPVVYKESAPRFGRKKAKKVVESPFGDDFDIMAYTKRWILEPNSRETVKLKFSVDLIGSYHDVLAFKVVGGKDEPFNLKVHGQCSYPDVDRLPVSVFGKIVKKLLLRTEMAFVEDANAFYFGGLLICKERTSKNQPATYRKQLSFVNTSPFATDVILSVPETGVKVPWLVETPSLHIPAGETGIATIGFNPTSSERYKTTLHVLVKDNPEPFEYNLMGDGCTPIVEVAVTSLDFGKVLLNREQTLPVEMKNSGRVPACWRVRGAQQLPACFKLSGSEGVIGAKTKGTLTITFVSPKPQVVKKPIQIDIMDKNKQKTFMSYHITVTAESFNINFDFAYPKGMDHLDFGTMKVGETQTLSCVLKNKGRYPATFKLLTIGKLIREVLHVTPTEGTVPPGDKGVTINFTLKDNTSRSSQRAKGIALQVSDVKTRALITSIPVPFSYSCSYSSWNISPANKLDFQSLRIGAVESRELVIENTGQFPLGFEMTASHVSEPSSQSPSGKRSPRGRKSAPRPQRRKASASVLQLGQFFISPSSAVIAPKSKQVVQVEFTSRVPGTYDSSFILKFSDTDPSMNGGMEYHVCATSCIPGIITDDFEKIFPGQPLCLRYDLDGGDFNAFLEDEQAFHFSPTIINQAQSVKFALVNHQPVPCLVNLKCKPKRVRREPQSNTLRKNTSKKPEPIRLNESSIEIPAKQSHLVDLIFHPTDSKDFQYIVEATVVGGTDEKTNTLTFGVHGKGALPSIAVLNPAGESLGKSPVISMGKNMIGFRKVMMIPVKNDSPVQARISVTAEESETFELENHDFVRNYYLDAGRQFNLAVAYRPAACEKSTFNIRVSVAENPKADIHITLTGEGFSEDMIFSGLQGDGTELLFKDNIVGRQQQVKFLMTNMCASDARFSWDTHPEIKFCPGVGHLRKGQSKEIVATFLSSKPIQFTGVKLKCTWKKIALNDSSAPDWDDSMKEKVLRPKQIVEPPTTPKKSLGRRASLRRSSRAFSIASARKGTSPVRMRRATLMQKKVVIEPEPAPESNELVEMIETKPEPAYTDLEETSKEVFVIATATSDYARYHISCTSLSFGPTMMFDKQTSIVELKNTSHIKFEYHWVTNQFEALKTDYAKYHPSPFSIAPVSGCIEPGHTTEFKVTFCPEEVDNFTSKLSCQIPFLSQMPAPEVVCTGFSRRPICHIGVELSDYLTAGKRHPDYTYPLPDGVRVIELKSTRIGEVARIRFEIINTTELPYEIFWTRDKEHSNPAIKCETQRGFISSGQHHMAVFTYTPKSLKTVESLWHFTIPDQDIVVNVLVVGRIVHQFR